MDDQVPVPPPPDAQGVYLCVLASGSSGNCSLLVFRRGGITRCLLIDLGLSPRRTVRLLAGAGLGMHQVDGALVTHLDHDHLNQGWRTQMPGHARVWLHERHARRVGGWSTERDTWAVSAFEDDFRVDECIRVRPLMMAHDELGVSAFRVDFSGELGECSLGFATDLGHVDAGLAGHFGGVEGGEDTDLPGRRSVARSVARPVDVLAIESNYCPAMQHASARPEALKSRIMGGRGHLSNQEALSAILQIEPREHVVLLHLSRQCNCPNVVSALHAGADYALTISSQMRPTRWVRVGAGERSRAPVTPRFQVNGARAPAGTLWGVPA